MELLGENISDLRKKQPGQQMSLSSVLRLGLQMLEAIKGMHDVGLIHRDIKPSNFAMGLGDKSSVCVMIDFGLSKKFRSSNGEIRPARDSPGFRGTARYASVNAHLEQDLGRRDDLWSLFYVIIELSLGSLPWSRMKEKDDISAKKQLAMRNPDLLLESDLPPEFLAIMQHLTTLSFEEKPDYAYLQSLLNKRLLAEGYSEETPFDWETTQRKTGVSGSRSGMASSSSAAGAGASSSASGGARRGSVPGSDRTGSVVGSTRRGTVYGSSFGTISETARSRGLSVDLSEGGSLASSPPGSPGSSHYPMGSFSPPKGSRDRSIASDDDDDVPHLRTSGFKRSSGLSSLNPARADAASSSPRRTSRAAKSPVRTRKSRLTEELRK